VSSQPLLLFEHKSVLVAVAVLWGGVALIEPTVPRFDNMRVKRGLQCRLIIELSWLLLAVSQVIVNLFALGVVHRLLHHVRFIGRRHIHFILWSLQTVGIHLFLVLMSVLLHAYQPLSFRFCSVHLPILVFEQHCVFRFLWLEQRFILEFIKGLVKGTTSLRLSVLTNLSH
jgi:hypothetical protein